MNVTGGTHDTILLRWTGHGRSTATGTLRVQDGVHSSTETGQGPFNALHLCLRKCLSKVYPSIATVRLTDYKVRVLDSNKGTAANVRVLIEWSDHRRSWSTVGVSDNVIEASWEALVDAIRLELMRLTEQDPSIDRAWRITAGACKGEAAGPVSVGACRYKWTLEMGLYLVSS